MIFRAVGLWVFFLLFLLDENLIEPFKGADLICNRIRHRSEVI